MKNCLIPLLIVNFFLLLTPVSADPAQEKSCKQYVQDFYDWYLKICTGVHEAKDDPTVKVFKNSKFTFSSELQRELKDDHDFAAKFPGEIVGLDFDPFFNGQDMGSKYTVAKVSKAGAKYHAEVFATFNGKKNSKPDVIPELTFEKGHWVFVNFLYPGASIKENGDLLSVLKKLKKDRPPLPKTGAKESKPADKGAKAGKS